MEKVLAAVRVGPNKTEIREFPMPDIPSDGALLKMEVAGICGTDVKLYKTPPTPAPVIMGHENIGVIAKAGRDFMQRKGLREGDLVFVEHYVSCGKCEWCHKGQYRHCENTDWRFNPEAIRYGYTSAEKAPHLWGGFAQYLYLPWNSVVHHVLGFNPELRILFDEDPATASATRAKLFDQIATDRTPVMGYHFPWPGLAHIRRTASGYEWVPTVWDWAAQNG